MVSGVDLPRRFRAYQDDDTYPLADMPLQSSFAVPQPECRALVAAAVGYKKRHPNWNFTTAIQYEDGVKVMRLWRVAPFQ